jgi:hypothetical protein
MEAVLNTILLEFHRLAAWDIHRRSVQALVGFKPNAGLPLALEMAFLGGDSFLAAIEAVATDARPQTFSFGAFFLTTPAERLSLGARSSIL